MNTIALSRKQAGFTLTELMIVVTIIAIIAAIGLPAYGNYARAAKRTDTNGDGKANEQPALPPTGVTDKIKCCTGVVGQHQVKRGKQRHRPMQFKMA